jgi:phosphohistidine swiveling domain-containing protein
MKQTRMVLTVVAAVLLTVAPMLAGSAVIGSVAGSTNATIDGQALMPKTTVFSGDSLQVKDGAAVVALGSQSRLVFGRETAASFLRDGREVTVLLGRGNVSLYQGQAGMSLRVKVGTVTVTPTGEYKTLGEVAMLNGAVVVTAKEGKLRVESNGTAQEIAKGKTVTVAARPARAPQGGAGSGSVGLSTSTALQVGSVAAGGTSAVLSGMAISRAGDAKDAAAAANATAAQAVTGASDATAAATAAGDAANAAGCALNEALLAQDQASTYTPPTGFSCD